MFVKKQNITIRITNTNIQFLKPDRNLFLNNLDCRFYTKFVFLIQFSSCLFFQLLTKCYISAKTQTPLIKYYLFYFDWKSKLQHKQ